MSRKSAYRYKYLCTLLSNSLQKYSCVSPLIRMLTSTLAPHKCNPTQMQPWWETEMRLTSFYIVWLTANTIQLTKDLTLRIAIFVLSNYETIYWKNSILQLWYASTIPRPGGGASGSKMKTLKSPKISLWIPVLSPQLAMNDSLSGGNLAFQWHLIDYYQSFWMACFKY